MGFFGYSVQRVGPPQPRHLAKIDIEAALLASGEAMSLAEASRVVDAPLFSGGVLDAWPAWAVDVLALAKAEGQWIDAYISHVNEKAAKRG